MWRKRIQVGLIHVAVAITLVPINSTLNRIMQNELGLSATLVAVLASLPYVFSPIQVAIGSFSDRYPLFGFRRTPYILVGLLLCVAGLVASPHIAYLLAEDYSQGLIYGVFAFGAWGMGYNLATVAYFSLATEISGEEGRSRTIATMFFMMIVGIIITSMKLGDMLTVEEGQIVAAAQVITAFYWIAGAALVIGLLGLFGLEPRHKAETAEGENYSWLELFRSIAENPQALRFFFYLILLLTAILGQDILLEAFAGFAFGLPVDVTSRITSIWGTAFLLTLVLGALFEKRFSKLSQARMGAWSALASFVLIIISGFMLNTTIFYIGVVLLGAGTGLSTVSNLSLMLDMTTAENVGLYMGAWGMAGAVSRLLGNLVGGIIRDNVSILTNNVIMGYIVVFSLEIVMLFVSLWVLRSVDISLFRANANQQVPYFERAAVAGDGG